MYRAYEWVDGDWIFIGCGRDLNQLLVETADLHVEIMGW